jgi:hypothetical protein
MGIEDKASAAEWVEGDLQQLCDEKRRETPRLEFKRELDLSTAGLKAEAEQDIQGLANSGGGHLIYGIDEDTLSDGSLVAGTLMPLADGALPEQLNNVLDDRGEPKVPFDLHVISAQTGGIYIVIEVFGRRRPHRAANGRYYIRRNLRVREMSEAEIADGYRDRFRREALATQAIEQRRPDQPIEQRVHRGLTPAELALYRAETGDERPPGWMSVIAYPLNPPSEPLLPPTKTDPEIFRQLSLPGLWRRQEGPLSYLTLRRHPTGLVGVLPPGDDSYPRYLIHLWPDGLLEYGVMMEPMFRDEDPAKNRVVASHAMAQYSHDFLVLAAAIFETVGYRDEVLAQVRFDHVDDHVLLVDTQRVWTVPEVIKEQTIEATWRGDVAELGSDGARIVTKDALDMVFLAAGLEHGAYFFTPEGEYNG